MNGAIWPTLEDVVDRLNVVWAAGSEYMVTEYDAVHEWRL